MPKQTPLRCGVIGTGAFAATHAQAIARSPLMSLAAACDIDRAHAQAFTERWGGTLCNDQTALLGEQCDIVIICSPDATHAGIITAIMNDAKAPPVLITEKPLCTAHEQLRTLAEVVIGKKTHLIVDHTRRFNAAFIRLHDLIDSKVFGALRSIHWRYYAGWLHIGVHAIDTLRMLIGECRCIASVDKGTDRAPNDPMLDVTLASERFPDASIVFEAVPEHPYALFDAEFFFQQGRIRIVFDDIFIDRISASTAGRQYLMFERHERADDTVTALLRLYEQCAALLATGDRKVLGAASFAAAQGTMEVLLEAMDRATR